MMQLNRLALNVFTACSNSPVCPVVMDHMKLILTLQNSVVTAIKQEAIYYLLRF